MRAKLTQIQVLKLTCLQLSKIEYNLLQMIRKESINNAGTMCATGIFIAKFSINTYFTRKNPVTLSNKHWFDCLQI